MLRGDFSRKRAGMLRHILSVLWKQGKDTLQNKEILIQFVMFPVITIIMENAIEIPGMPEHYFAMLFGAMYLGMAPLLCTSAILAEEKEKNTLRVLLMSNVRPGEYLAGVGIYVWCLCMAGAAVIGLAGGYRGSGFGNFMLIMGAGFLVSIIVGAAVGVFSRNQMMATSISMPVMLILSFLPMLAAFNESIAKLARVTYSGQIHLLMGQVENLHPSWGQTGILLLNLAAALLFFAAACRRNKRFAG